MHGCSLENNLLSLPVKIKLTKSYGLYLTTSLVASVIFTYYYFLYTHEYPPGSSEKIANYQADRVFQTRVLITSIANLLKPSLPVLKEIFQWMIPYPVDFQVLLQLINVLFTFGLLLTLPHLLSCFEVNEYPWVSLLVFFPISWNYIFINGFFDGAGLFYCYDIPSLTFFSLGLILFIKRKWIWFLPHFYPSMHK